MTGPRAPRTRLAAGAVAWVLACVAALAVGLTAVNAIGTGLLGPADEPLTSGQGDAALASATAGPSAVPSAAPSPAPDAAGLPEVVATAGGTVIARCRDGSAEVVSAAPAQGFRVQQETEDGGPRVRFRDGGTRYEITLSCAGDRPVAAVEADD